MAPRNNRLNPNAPSRGQTENLVQVLDSYVRPARDVMGEQAMARGFSDMGRTLGGLAKQELSRELTETSRQAQVDAMQGIDPSQEYAEVRMGNIFRPHSRAYMEAYNATMGRIQAIEFRDDTAVAYAESGLDSNTDPEAFREWYSGRVNEFLNSSSDNPFFRAGAMPLLEQTSFNMSAQHTSNIVRTIEANRVAAARRLSAEATMATFGEWGNLETARLAAVEAGDVEGAAAIRSQQAALVGGAISGVGTDFYETGDAGSAFRGATLEGALDLAEATGNMELLATITEAARSGTLRLTPQEMLDITNRGQQIEADYMTQIRNQETLDSIQREEENRQVADWAADMSGTAEYAGMTPMQILEANPEVRDSIMNSPNSAALLSAFREAHDTVTNISTEVSPEVAMENEVDIRAAIQDGTISNPQDAIEWMRSEQGRGRMFTAENRNLLMRLGSEAGQAGAVINDSNFRNSISTAARRATADLVQEPVYDATGRAVDRQGAFIEDQVRSYMQDRAGTLNPQSPTYAQDLRNLQDQAIMAAHDAYRQINPETYEEITDSAVEEGTAAMSPGFIQEIQRREIERQGEVAAAQAAIEAAAQGRELLGVDENGNPIVPVEPEATPEVTPEVTPDPVPEPVPAEPAAVVEPEPVVEEPASFVPEEIVPDQQPLPDFDMDMAISTLEALETAMGSEMPLSIQEVAQLWRQIELETGNLPVELRERFYALADYANMQRLRPNQD